MLAGRHTGAQLAEPDGGLHPTERVGASGIVGDVASRPGQRQQSLERAPVAVDDDASGDYEEPRQWIPGRPATIPPGGVGAPDGLGRDVLGIFLMADEDPG